MVGSGHPVGASRRPAGVGVLSRRIRSSRTPSPLATVADPELGGARFPPTVWPDKADVEKAYARWSELGLGKPKGASD